MVLASTAVHPAHPGRQREREDRALRRYRKRPRFSDGGEHDEPELPLEHPDGLGFLISHHPELINYLASSQGVHFFRDNLGPVRTQPFETTEDDGLLPAEIVARGWE